MTIDQVVVSTTLKIKIKTTTTPKRPLKLRCQKMLIESDAQKVMAKSSYGCKFHDLKYFEVGLFFHIP